MYHDAHKTHQDIAGDDVGQRERHKELQRGVLLRFRVELTVGLLMISQVRVGPYLHARGQLRGCAGLAAGVDVDLGLRGS